MPRSALCPVLVRREDELAILEEALLAAHRGQGRFVVVSGEAGIGKTRLVTELSREARRLGSSVLMGGCSEAELSLPYLPFVEAIGNHLASEDVGALAARLGPSQTPLAQLFPQLSAGEPPEPTADPAQAKLRLFESIVSLLTVIAEEGTLVLVLEDVHWADDSTRELLDHLARRLATLAILVIVTFRSDELHRRHPLAPTLQAWRRSSATEIVALEPLPTAGIAEMVAAILGPGAIDRELSDILHQRTEGNPFVLEEMLREASEDIGDTGTWSRQIFDQGRIPETVRDTILLRLARLARDQVPILEAAAVLGRSFEYSTLLAVAGADEASVHAALETAVAEQLVEEDADRPGHYRWRHALTQEAIYTDIVTPRRQAIHARVADVLGGSEAMRPVDLAHHLLGAGRFDDAVPVCLQGAEQAEHALAFGEAIAMLERALPHLSDPLERARVICRIGRDHSLNGHPATGERFLVEGIDALDGLGEAVEAARFRVVLGRCLWEGEKPDEAQAEYVQARDVLAAQGPSAELAMAHMRLAGLDAFELDYDGCLEHSRRAAEIAEEAGADFERVWALGFIALGLLDSGEHERGFELMDACYKEAAEKGYWYIANNVTWNDVWTRTHTLEGDLERRLERFERLPKMASNDAGLAILTSYVKLVHGDLAGAREAGKRALELYEELGYAKMAWRSRVQLAAVLVELGRHADAERLLPPTSSRTELQDIVYDAAARIRSRLAHGEIEAALALAAEIVERADDLALYPESLAVATEALVAGGDLDAAEWLIDRAAARPTRAGRSYLDEMRGRVLLAGDDAAAARPPLADAAETAERAGYVLVALRRRLLHAEAVGRGGDPEAAECELGAIVETADRARAALVRTDAEATAARLGIPLPPRPHEELDDEEPRSTEVVMGERLITSLFADVRGYTELAASASPEELAERMASLYRFATAAVARHGGIVDKFAGDAVMATFNVSGTRVDHCVDALEAALALRDKARLIDLDLGIGIAVGPAVLGRGASDANVAVRGEATNLAARLQAAAGVGEILLSDEAHRRVERWLADRELRTNREQLDLKGFDGPRIVFRIDAPVLAART